jgi:hypothetical protein
LLAAVGIYSVVAYSGAQRTRELAIFAIRQRLARHDDLSAELRGVEQFPLRGGRALDSRKRCDSLLKFVEEDVGLRLLRPITPDR